MQFITVNCALEYICCLNPTTLYLSCLPSHCQSRCPLQLRQCHNGSATLPWQRASSPKMFTLSRHLRPLPGIHQKTLFKHLSPYRRGPRAPPSPGQLSQSTPSKTQTHPALQRAQTPSPLFPGPRASGLPSVIILLHLHLAVRALGHL